MRQLLFFVVLPAIFFSCSNLKLITENKLTPSLKLVSSIEIPFDETFQNTKVGGLSGIDYDAKNDLYYLISDDRSMFNESRFYTAKIRLLENKGEGVNFQSVSTLKNETGKLYDNWNTKPTTSADPEDLRFNPKTNTLVWSSEGARVIAIDKEILQNPSLNFMNLKGDFLENVTLPEN